MILALRLSAADLEAVRARAAGGTVSAWLLEALRSPAPAEPLRDAEVSVRVPPDLRAELVAAARAEGASLAQVARGRVLARLREGP
jgi:hypothetical protein